MDKHKSRRPPLVSPSLFPRTPLNMTRELDYSQPLAPLLHTGISEIHESITSSPSRGVLFRGGLPKDEYVRYLMMLWYIYQTLELALDKHASHPALEPTYNPTVLARARPIVVDISHLLQVPENAWKSHPIHVDLAVNTPPALIAYVNRIRELSGASKIATLSDLDNSGNDNTPVSSTTNAAWAKVSGHETAHLLLAHAYVRYLGDLSGGQIIRHLIIKAYNLNSSMNNTLVFNPGVSLYTFKKMHSNEVANQGEIKHIKEWFKEGMNRVGGTIGVEGKRAMVKEAINVFDLNADLFDSLRIPDELLKSSSHSSEEQSETINSNSESKSKHESTSKTSGPPQSKSDSIPIQTRTHRRTHIVVVLLALYAAHFVWNASVDPAGLFKFEQWILSLLSVA
ncbi:hypothetical protein AX15_000087 [Amanita polypyramis BW_CC]|nr:hypothetical protein AX15_000087 [Amanita polypyramis BW_CC]